ncbi:tetratricopeptide repeat-containing hybrid sensor histidine kinase/response regulator [Aquimarina pacifica]|uniref:tetratricopeptide repeat-containing hybrid sensor histidine kinase/response regulator n=1 Tax=Aquimarina pacifica TaxID=1296415 RepID=UPI00046FD09C|nr:ATP-binding protein [Aquimarina pacifica]
MLIKVRYLILKTLLICCFFGSSQTNELQENYQINDSIENYLDSSFLLIDKSELTEAFSNIQKAKIQSSNNQSKNYHAKTNVVLAKFYRELGDLKQAEKHIVEAIEAQIQSKDESTLTTSLIIYGSIALQLRDYKTSEKVLKEAFILNQKNTNKAVEKRIQIYQALLSLSKNQPELALTQFDKLTSDISNITEDYFKAILYLNKAKAHTQLDQIEDAKKANIEALSLSAERGYARIQSESYALYSNIYEKEKDHQTSLNYLKKHLDSKNALLDNNKKIIAQETRTKLNFDKNYVLIEELTEENIQQQKSLQVGRLATILAIALITILSLLTLSLYKNNNLRARANELLQNKNTELIIAKENVERASEAKVQFLSTITHELRTPLYAVTGLTHLLLEESPTPNQKEHLNSLKFSGEYLLSLINNILDLNKLEANKVEIENTSFNLKKRINDVLIALGKSAKDRNNELHYEFASSIPTKLKGDPLKISQILINLIGNSIKFTQKGDIWIRVHPINITETKALLNFEIEDNGVGISEKKQQSIFENFTQGSVQINRKFGGTGLGLSIVKNLLSLMNSEIKLESELGKGSKFSFDLTFDIIEDKNANYMEEAKKIDYSILADKRVLVVEDNKINQLITRKILEKNKIVCDVADNGNIAINKAKELPFDLILMDIHMPGISGIEATVKIREFDQNIPILALTAVTLNDNLDEFYDNGFNDIIPKPFKTEEFFTKLHKAFVNKKTTS